MIDLSKLKIKEIAAYLQKNPKTADSLCPMLAKDARSGVRKLALRIEKEQKLLLREKKRLANLFIFERKYRAKGFNLIAGVDEAGRGPLAGPVVAAAVVFSEEVFIAGVNDSKKLSADKRSLLFTEIKAKALAVGIGIVEAPQIDIINIYHASLEAMFQAVNSLTLQPDFCLSDAYMILGLPCPQLPLIKGDARSFTIAAASIIAKVTRDRIMEEADILYPQYGFRQHKGYPTKSHKEALQKYGATPLHRESFQLF